MWVTTCGGDGGTEPTPVDPTPPPPPPPANRAPTATGSIPAQTIPAGESVTVNVAGNFTDPDGNTLSFLAASSDDGVATASVSGSNVTINGVSAGTATVTVTASDPGGLSATQSISVTVEAVNQAPVAEGMIDDLGLVVGADATVDVAASFSDPDGDELTYAVTSSDTAVATVAVAGAMVTVTAVAAGSATVTVTATDPGELSASQEFGVTVQESNEPPVAEGTIDDQTVVAGSGVEVDVSGNFKDPNDDELTYAATSSDEAIATVSTSGAVVTIMGIAPGTATVTVTASDAGMLSASQEFGVTVEAANQAPVAEGTIDDQSMVVGDEATLDVAASFRDPDGDELTFTANSSDTTVATVSPDGATVTVVAVASGNATVTVTATDPGGLSASQEFGVTVEAANQAPVAEGTIDDQTVVAGMESGVDVIDNFSDPHDDELTYSATSSDTTVTAVATEGTVVTVMGIAPGSATVTVTATDPGGLSASQEFGVTVEAANQAPMAEGTIDDQTVVAGMESTVDVTDNFSDPDGDDLTYSATSSDEAVATLSTSGAVVTIMGVTPGNATVTVTATDSGGLSASQEFGVTVATPPAIADTIPTHDMIVDSMVVLDVSPYFEEGGLTYAAATSDETVAVVVVDGSTVTTTGTGADSVGVSETMLSVTATNENGLSVTQDSIVVRVHQEEYGSLPGISVDSVGTLFAEIVPGSPTPLPGICLQIRGFPVGGTSFTVFWSEWQRATGGGWVVAQDNNKTHVTAVPDQGGSVCPINVDDESFPPGIYRLVGHVQIGEEPGYYKTNTFEKPEG